MSVQCRFLWPLVIGLTVPAITARAEDISVTEKDAVYTAKVDLQVQADAITAWSVLTDYHKVYLIVRSAETDSIARQLDGRIFLYQTLRKEKRRVPLIMVVDEDSLEQTVSIRELRNSDQDGFEGHFKITPDNSRCIIQCTFKKRIKKWYSRSLWTKTFVAREVSGIIDRIRDAIDERTAVDIEFVPETDAEERQ